MNWTHPTGKQPESVNIIACGPTMQTYHAAHMTYEPQVPQADETWLVNKGIRTVRGDLAFVMDDLVGECSKSESYQQALNAFPGPIITSTVDLPVRDWFDDQSKLHELPIEAMIRFFGMRILRARGEAQMAPQLIDRVGRECGAYWHNSIPYMLAYAVFIGVKNIGLYGADYTHPSNPNDVRESDRANCEYWVGLARGLGTAVTVTTDTTLLNKYQHKGGLWFYGFGARQPVLGLSSLEDCQAMADYIRGPEAQSDG